ncbi:hypothetical protein CRG98_022401 [Punica granatum]|uniref:Uncharacterized protein n=1 Tax=Punica granatum TaxID=22663 RepID=A0A2I0JNW3_PUNGR|nr:hypothetical protein CRG98_022401 [Punica granatum]
MADLREKIHGIKRAFEDHSGMGNNRQPEGRLSESARTAAPKHNPGSDWFIVNTDAAQSASKSCLASALQQTDQPISLSWFQASNESKPLQAQAKAAYLPLAIAADRDWKCTWILRSDNLHAHDFGQHGFLSNFQTLSMFKGYPSFDVVSQ